MADLDCAGQPVRAGAPTHRRGDDRIPGGRYLSWVRCLSLREGAFTYDEVSGPWLRAIAWQAAHTRTVNVHLEWHRASS
ncbi:hypothetical protein ACWDFL_36320 [Streptomyces bungoensis]